jgi:histidine triad (HIT) family protein
MDIDPKADGHTLVIPKKHVTDFTEMSDEDVLMVNGIAKKVGLKIVDRLKARGITFAVNYGDSQAVKHYHLHLLPNYTIEEMSGRSVEEIYDIIKGDF